MSSFAALGLLPPFVRAVADLEWSTPTPVQVAAIPAILDGRDVWACARTGSGKTGAFVLPVLQLLAAPGAEQGRRSRTVRALVLVPTRELATQIADAIGACARHLPSTPKVCVAVGGVSINPQLMALRGGADVLVATPGRLLDLVDHNALDLAFVEILVLDEADRLLSLGFADEIGRVLAGLGHRQSLLFSATFPPAVRSLAEKVLDDPRAIDVDPAATLAELQGTIVQRAIAVDIPRRTMLLRHLLDTEGWPFVLVFVASRYTANHVTDKLKRADITAAALHGDLSQGARTQALADFGARRIRVLVATDVAARGLDIADLPAVVNYDLPRSPADYLHRIGRTGRAGEAGTAVSFVSADTEAHWRILEKRHRLDLPRERIVGFEPAVLEPASAVSDPNGGVKGRRKSKKDKLRAAAALKSGSG